MDHCLELLVIFCIRFDFNELSDDVILEEIENKTKGSNGKMVESIQEQVANDNNENDDGDNDDNDEEESDFEIVPNQKSDDDDESMDSDDDEVSTTTKSTTHQQKSILLQLKP